MMRLSCASSRVVTAAVFSYIGASPIPNAGVRDVVVVSAVVTALAWPRLLGRRAASCSLSPVAPSVSWPERPESSPDDRDHRKH